MERGPMALFGAIIAVGVGPALWLGVQLGAVDAVTRPPSTTVREELPAAVQNDQGGYGAGEESDDSSPSSGWTVPPATRRIKTTPSPEPSVSPSPTPSISVST